MCNLQNIITRDQIVFQTLYIFHNIPVAPFCLGVDIRYVSHSHDHCITVCKIQMHSLEWLAIYIAIRTIINKQKFYE